MSHHVDDIRTALETSPQVREAVAAMLAALGEARECGVYSFTDTCDYEHTVETRFAKYQQAVDFERWVAIASKAINKWIMESRDDDMDAKQTVAVQKAIGATHALVGIANGAEWRAYQQLEADTRRSVTERMAQTILDALQQSPPATDNNDMDANGQTVTVWTGQVRYGTSTSFGIVGTKEEAIEWVETQEDASGIIWEDFKDGKGGLITRIADDAGIRTLLVLSHEVTLPAPQQPPTAPPPAATKHMSHISLIPAAEYVEGRYKGRERRGECRVYWEHYSVNDVIGDMENGYAISFGAGGLATIDASTQLTVVWLDEVVAAPPPADSEDARPQSLAKELAAMLNKHGIDNATNTYDFVLADYLVDCITAFKKARNTDTSLRWLEPANQPAEAAPVDALAKARERIAELEAERDSAVREGAEKASSPLYDKYESVPNLASQIGQFFDEAGGVNYVEIEMIAQDGRTFTLNIQRNEGKTPHQIITELKAEVRLLQAERDSAVREANGMKTAIRWAEKLLDGYRKTEKPNPTIEIVFSIISTVLDHTPAASRSAPESEATDA